MEAWKRWEIPKPCVVEKNRGRKLDKHRKA